MNTAAALLELEQWNDTDVLICSIYKICLDKLKITYVQIKRRK
jgi:hypothetical protein